MQKKKKKFNEIIDIVQLNIDIKTMLGLLKFNFF